ncbi:T-complex protein 11-like protein 1 [Lampris incognitus]|uniref:T-complex protein 11-like protein 1 n=1 Tax=Lampris incognitus TaxID=2546036 RepID=UPI0024B5A802|nr:T-complex protein 11-like protein 1 [Lampris incognitus]
MPNKNTGDAVDDPHTDVPPLEQLDSPTGSPPSVSNMMDLENCVANLSLAHEIVMNADFSVKHQSPPKHSLEERVTEIMHRAFWDSLHEQLTSETPNYSHAMILLQEVKTMLQSLLLPGHVRLRSQLDEVLDIALIRQEADHGSLDIHKLAHYIIGIMGSMCAPIRDPEIKALRVLTDPVELLREIFRVLGLMKMDMVNFTVQTLRPHLLQQAVQYEQAKFQQILEKQPSSLDCTTAWLQKAAQEMAPVVRPLSQPGMETWHGHSCGPVSPTAVLRRAYLHLLHWDPHDQKYPETVLMDRARLDTLGQRLTMLVLEASILLLTCTQCGGVVFSINGLVGKLKQTITALLEGSHTREADLREELMGLGDKVVVQVTEAMVSHGQIPMPQDSQDLLKGQISDLWKHNNPIRSLIGDRVQGYLQAMLEGSFTKRSPELPDTLRVLSAELVELGTAFGQIAHFNQTVFGPFYAPILRRLLFSPPEAETAEDSR